MPTVAQIRQGITGRSSTMTCMVDGRDHLISAQASEAGSAAGEGCYLALCGHLAVAAALVIPPGPTCRDYETALHRITTAVPTSHRGPGLLARLLRWRLPPHRLEVHDRREPPEGVQVTRWYVASLADSDTHLAEPTSPEHLVTAQCDGRRFRPLVALPATPLDDEQVCPTCQALQVQATSTARVDE